MNYFHKNILLLAFFILTGAATLLGCASHTTIVRPTTSTTTVPLPPAE